MAHAHPYTGQLPSDEPFRLQAGQKGSRFGGSFYLIHLGEPSLNIFIHGLFVIPMIGEGSMDLTKYEIRMLKMEFLWTPSIRNFSEDKLNDLHVGPCDYGNLILIEDDVLISCFQRRHGGNMPW